MNYSQVQGVGLALHQKRRKQNGLVLLDIIIIGSSCEVLHAITVSQIIMFVK